MPYRNLPNYGNKISPRPLNVAGARDVPLRSRRAPLERRGGSWQPPAMAKPRSRRVVKWPALMAAVTLVFVFAVFHGFSGTESIAQAAFEKSAARSSQAQAASQQEQRLEAYKRTVGALVAAHPEENIAVSTIDLSDNQGLTLGDQGTFTAASTAKLITGITLLHEAEAGKVSLDNNVDGQQAGALLRNMIIYSDNDAWLSLNNDCLSHDVLKSYMSSLGLIDYDPDINTLLPMDMARLMQKLYEGKLLSRTNTELLLSYMRQANKTEYIVANIPAGYSVYHKAGWLDGLMHDVAIISDGKKSIVLAVYTYDGTAVGDNPSNQDFFKQVTAAALKAYFPAK